MGLQRFERRLERLVEGGFGKAFRSGLQPVEIGRRLVREMDSRPHARRARHRRARTTSSCASPTTTSSASPGSTTRSRRARRHGARHARDEGYHFDGPVEVVARAPTHGPARRSRGRRRRSSASEARQRRLARAARRSPGRSSASEPVRHRPACPTARSPLSDPQVSRHHAEIRRDERRLPGRRPRLDQRHAGQRRLGAGARARRRRRDRRRRNRRSATRSRSGRCPIRSSRS